MNKEIVKTAKIIEGLRRVAGEDVNLDGLAVFEAVILSNRPLNAGGIYHKAVVSQGTMEAMVKLVNEGRGVPFITFHNDEQLPMGRVFQAELRAAADNDLVELHALFYIDRNRQDILSAIETGTLDEVSVSILPKNLLCSECGWDFFGEDADPWAIYECTCKNDHVMGQNGAHARLIGLDKFNELSGVTRGAAQNTRILDKRRRAIAADERERMAASGRRIDRETLFASMERKPSMSNPEFTALLAQYQAATAAEAASKAKSEAAEAKLQAAEAKVAELTAAVEAANAKVAEAEATDAAKQASDLKAAADFLKEVAKLKGIAATGADPSVPGEIPALIAAIKETQKNLVALPIGGVSESADAGEEKPDDQAELSAFKIKR